MSQLLHTPAEAAAMLRCTEWWLRDKARKRRIPFTLVGGAVHFSDAHLTEIIQIFEQEVQPREAHLRPSTPRRPRTTTATPSGVRQLKARRPKRRLAS